MNAKKIVISIFRTCLTIGLLLIIAMFVYKFCIKTYDFGYRIFADEPMSPAPGYTTSVAIVEGKTVMEIGEILEERGLIKNAYIFYLQELVSSYHGQLMPGVYELSTAMTPEEMMAIMAASYSEDDEDSEEEEVSQDSTDDYYDADSENDTESTEGEELSDGAESAEGEEVSDGAESTEGEEVSDGAESTEGEEVSEYIESAE